MGVVKLFENIVERKDNEVYEEFYWRSETLREAKPTVQIPVRINPELNQRVRKCAKDYGLSLSEVVRLSLEMMMEAVLHPDWDEEESIEPEPKHPYKKVIHPVGTTAAQAAEFAKRQSMRDEDEQ